MKNNKHARVAITAIKPIWKVSGDSGSALKCEKGWGGNEVGREYEIEDTGGSEMRQLRKETGPKRKKCNIQKATADVGVVIKCGFFREG